MAPHRAFALVHQLGLEFHGGRLRVKDLDDELSLAFARWSEARDALAALRARLGADVKAGGQLAPSPEMAALSREIEEAEATARERYKQLVEIAERRAALREQKLMDEIAARIAQSKRDSGR